MWPHAKLRLDLPTEANSSNESALIAVGHGDLIGRMSTATLCIDDARVSEAHAMVSLRGGELHLLALRRRFFVNNELCSEVPLTPKLRVELAQGLGFVVEELALAPTVLGLRVVGRGARPLLGVCSIVAEGDEGILSGYRADALAYLWNRDEDWRLQMAGEEARPLEAGDRFVVGERTYEIIDLPLARAGADKTLPGESQGTLSIVTRFDTVHIHRKGRGHELSLSGISARILSELGAVGVPLSWQAIAKELWSGPLDDTALRRRWDVSLSRLRRKLRGAGIRANLVRTDGMGNAELFLLPGDELLDEG